MTVTTRIKLFDFFICKWCFPKLQIKSPSTPTFFTNRALCYLKLKNWDQALQDCRRALDLDRSVVKGHFFMGQALVELSLYDEAISSLKRGMV